MKTKPSDEALRSVQTIQQITAEHFGLNVNNIIGPSRFRDYTLPRRIAMLLSRLVYPHISYPQLGYCFNRDHSTVMTGCKEASRICASNANVYLELNSIARAFDFSLPSIDQWPSFPAPK